MISSLVAPARLLFILALLAGILPELHAAHLSPDGDKIPPTMIFKYDDGYAIKIEVLKQPDVDSYSIVYTHVEMKFDHERPQIPSPINPYSSVAG